MKILTLFAFIFAFSFSIHAQSGTTKPAQVETPVKNELSETEKKILQDLSKAQAQIGYCGYLPDDPECKANNYEQVYREAIAKAVNYPKVVNAIVAQAFRGYASTRIGAKGAVQVSQAVDEQNAVLIPVIVQQNQKIIELLEKLANKK